MPWIKGTAIAVALAMFIVLSLPYLESHKEKTHKEIISENSKAMAVITIYGKDHQEIAHGSGFFISSDGVLVTNYHVVAGHKIGDVQAMLPDTRATFFLKSVIAKDEENDYVVLKFDAINVPYVHLGDSDAIKAGQRVVAIGTPLGLENTVSEGVISNASRQQGKQHFIQFTAPVSPGSSGGGLFDMRGEAIGVTAGMFTGSTETPAQNLNYAVPINLIRDKLSGKGSGKLPKDDASNYYLLGQLAANRHNFGEAVRYYKQSVALDDNNPDVYLGLAEVFYEQGKYDKEVDNLEIAVSLSPQNYEAIYMLGNAYEDVGRYDDAIKQYKTALKLKPDDKNSMYYLAFLSVVMKKDLKTARQIQPKLMKLDPGLGREIRALIKMASH